MNPDPTVGRLGKWLEKVWTRVQRSPLVHRGTASIVIRRQGPIRRDLQKLLKEWHARMQAETIDLRQASVDVKKNLAMVQTHRDRAQQVIEGSRKLAAEAGAGLDFAPLIAPLQGGLNDLNAQLAQFGQRLSRIRGELTGLDAPPPAPPVQPPPPDEAEQGC